MKKLIYLLVIFVISTNSHAQKANAILFTENGEKFTAILNGLRQNEKPETNVKITDLNAEWYKLKVIFADSKLGEENFNLGLELGSENTYSIKKNSKGNYVLRPVSTVPLAEAPPTAAEQAVVVYNAAPAPAPVENYSVGAQTVTQQTTTTTQSSGTSDNVNISMGVNMNENGGGININMSGMDPDANANVHTTTTTTTSVSHSTTVPPPPPPSQIVYVPGYTGAIGCPRPISPLEFDELKSSIDSKTFEDTKMTMAKQVVGSKCLLASQVKQLMKSFDFENSKLDFAKFAFKHTYDIDNYYKVNDAFEFESSINDLTKYINAQR